MRHFKGVAEMYCIGGCGAAVDHAGFCRKCEEEVEALIPLWDREDALCAQDAALASEASGEARDRQGYRKRVSVGEWALTIAVVAFMAWECAEIMAWLFTN